VFKLRDLATQFVHTASLSAAARLNTSIKSSAAVDRTQTFNPLLRTLKPQSNGDTMIGTMAVTFGTTRKGLGALGPRPVLSSLYQM